MAANPWELTLPTARSRMGAWPDRGLCNILVKSGEANRDWWFPERGESTAPAKAICARCPVIEPCLQWALENREEGIWGGTSGRERRGVAMSVPCSCCGTVTPVLRGMNRTVLCSDVCRKKWDNRRQRNYQAGTQAQYMAEYRARKRESA